MYRRFGPFKRTVLSIGALVSALGYAFTLYRGTRLYSAYPSWTGILGIAFIIAGILGLCACAARLRAALLGQRWPFWAHVVPKFTSLLMIAAIASGYLNRF